MNLKNLGILIFFRILGDCSEIQESPKFFPRFGKFAIHITEKIAETI